MQRRTFLALISVSLGAVAGCTTSDNAATDTPVAGTPTAVPKRTSNDDGMMQTSELHQWLEDDEEDLAVEVEYIAVVDGSLRLRYVSQAGESGKLGDNEPNERAVVAGRYAQWEGDHRGTSLRATVVDEFGDPSYRWHCKAEWAAKFRNDEVSLDALRKQVSETVTDVK